MRTRAYGTQTRERTGKLIAEKIDDRTAGNIDEPIDNHENRLEDAL